MKKLLFAALCLLAAGCKKDGPVDNSATRYTKGLQEDTAKARAAAEKANAAIAEQDARMKDAEGATN